MPNSTVILVPGFLGSSLDNTTSSISRTNYWMTPHLLLGAGFDRLGLAVPSEDLPAPAGGPLYEGRPLAPLYALLVGYLSVRGWRVITPLGDWRKPITYDGQALSLLIRAAAHDGPVQIVCHSRGGLVTRRALANLHITGDGAMVSRVVGMGVPHTGSLNAAQLLACYHPMKGTIASLAGWVPSWYSRPITKEAISCVARTWPGAYELLPAPTAEWVTGIDPDDLYLPATWASSPFAPVVAYLAGALNHWSSLPLNATGVEWVDVVGHGRYTPYGLADGYAITDRGGMVGDTEGDGTVRVSSAHPIARRVIRSPVAHDLIPSDGRVMSHIHEALSGTLTADVQCGGQLLHAGR